MVWKFSSQYSKYLKDIFIPITVSLALYIIFSPVLLILVLYRHVLLIFVKVCRPDLTLFDLGYDALYTTEQPEQFVHSLTICFVIDKQILIPRICEMFQDRIFTLKNPNGKKTYRKLTELYTTFMGYPFWASDPQFSPKNHVREYDYENTFQLPTPSDLSSLQAVLPKLSKHVWKPNQSHWEVLVLSKFSHPGGRNNNNCKTALIFRFDHGLCDGYSIITLFRTLFQSKFEVPESSHNRNIMTFWQKLGIVLTLPHEFVRQMWILPKTSYFSNPESTANHVCDISDYFQNGKIKAIKNKMGVQYMSVMHGAIGSALADVFKAINQTPPDYISATATFPTTSHPGGICNHWTSCFLELPSNANSSPYDRIFQTETALQHITNNFTSFNNDLCIKLITLLPVHLSRNFFGDNSDGFPGVDIAIFPCTSTKEFVDGGEIMDAFFVCNPYGQIGISINSWGVNNQQRIVFNMVENIFGTQIPPGFLSSKFLSALDVLGK